MTLLYVTEFLEKFEKLLAAMPDCAWTEEVQEKVLDLIGDKYGEELVIKSEDETSTLELVDAAIEALTPRFEDDGDIEDMARAVIRKIEELEEQVGDLEDKVTERNRDKRRAQWYKRCIMRERDQHTVPIGESVGVTVLKDQLEKAKVFLTDSQLARIEL